jgi:hypothetical protein
MYILKNIGGEITHGILLNGDAQKIKVITGGEITCPRGVPHSLSEICQPFFEKAGTRPVRTQHKDNSFMGKETLQNLLVPQFGDSS